MTMQTKQIKRGVLTLGVAIALTACQFPSQTPASLQEENSPPATPNEPLPRFDGITLRILTRDPLPIVEPLLRRGKEFSAKTGAKIEVRAVSFAELYDTIEADLSASEAQYDVIVAPPQWLADFARDGHWEDLRDRVENDRLLQWEDIIPFFREFNATYQNKISAIPLDGDFPLLYYRTDLLGEEDLEPPETWEEYLAIAETFHNRDLNKDGETDYGSCILQNNPHSPWLFWAIATSFLQSQGTEQGAFFDPETMKPLVNNQAFAKVLHIFKRMLDFAPPEELTADLEGTRQLFLSGRCALTLDWGDLGTLAIDSQHSLVGDRVDATILPGTKEVFNRQTYTLVECGDLLCPYAIDGINRAPYAAFGGWSGVINTESSETVKNAAYAFLSYVSQPSQSHRDVTLAMTGFNPYRISQVSDRQMWIEAGMNPVQAGHYLGAIKFGLQSPNRVADLRIPQNYRYQQEIFAPILSDFLDDRLSASAAMQQLEREWEDLTDAIGRESQKILYRTSIGL